MKNKFFFLILDMQTIGKNDLEQLNWRMFALK